MASSIKNIIIGIFVVVAVAVIAFMLLFLHPHVGDQAKTLRVRFADIDKVNVGTRVTFAGRPVGEVVSIEEIPDARTQRIDKHGDIYVYELLLKVDSSVGVFNTDEITLRTSGLLGEKSVEINPLPLKSGQRLQQVETDTIYATQTGSVDVVLKQFEVISQKIDLVLDDIHSTMDRINKSDMLNNLEQSISNIKEITTSLNQPERYKAIINNLYTCSERIHYSWTNVEHTLQEVSRLIDRAHNSWYSVDTALNLVNHRIDYSWNIVDDTLQTINRLISYTAQGNGSLGQILVGDDLYLRLKSILHKGETTMNDINSYGLLFQQDKRWQRLQAHRLRLLEKLCTPGEFARYFNRELDQITASLSRVSVILNDSDYNFQTLIYNPDFTKRFAETLRRVENVEEILKIYNEQLINQ